MIMAGRVVRVPIITRQPPDHVTNEPLLALTPTYSNMTHLYINHSTLYYTNPKPTKIWSPIKNHPTASISLFQQKKSPQLYHFSKLSSSQIRSDFPFTIQGTCWCSPPHFHCWDPDSPSRIVESNPLNPPC